MTLVWKSVGIWDGIVNPIYGCGVKMAPDINPIYAGFERSCPRDSLGLTIFKKDGCCERICGFMFFYLIKNGCIESLKPMSNQLQFG